MSLFTVILDFRGGTYIGQAEADCAQSEAVQWLANQRNTDLRSWQVDRAAAERLIQTENPIPLDGLTNAWCITGSISDRLFLVNVVQTVRRDVNSD